MWLGSITQRQVESLFPVFARFNGEYWELPIWLIDLNTNVAIRAYEQKINNNSMNYE